MARNVLGKLKLSPHAQSVIVIGAHIDHLGHGEWTGSRANAQEQGMVHPGADDNASGVAALLELARHLSELKRQGALKGNKDILLAAWSGEELGVLGSSYFVQALKKSSAHRAFNIDAALNLDMVGHLRDKLIIQGVGSSQSWPEILNQIPKDPALPLVIQSDPYLPTDSISFYVQGIPTLNVFSGAHDDYHTPRDTPEKLNYTGIKRVSEWLLQLVFVLEKNQKKITYQAVQKEQQPFARSFKVYLGTIPDYASSDVLGVKLSGVIKDSPAALAGLGAGDVIVTVEGKPIRNIYDYSNALAALTPGKTLKMGVRRRGKEIGFSIKINAESKTYYSRGQARTNHKHAA